MSALVYTLLNSMKNRACGILVIRLILIYGDFAFGRLGYLSPMTTSRLKSLEISVLIDMPRSVLVSLRSMAIRSHLGGIQMISKLPLSRQVLHMAVPYHGLSAGQVTASLNVNQVNLAISDTQTPITYYLLTLTFLVKYYSIQFSPILSLMTVGKGSQDVSPRSDDQY